jgi:hypothetical protein
MSNYLKIQNYTRLDVLNSEWTRLYHKDKVALMEGLFLGTPPPDVKAHLNNIAIYAFTEKGTQYFSVYGIVDPNTGLPEIYIKSIGIIGDACIEISMISKIINGILIPCLEIKSMVCSMDRGYLEILVTLNGK